MLVGQLPAPYVFLRIALGDRVGVLPHLLLLDLRPKLHQGKGAVEANVGGAVVLIIEAFEVAEAVGRLSGLVPRIADAVQLVRPDSSAIRQDVKLVEQLATVPERLRVILDDGLLQCVDLCAPVLIVLKADARDLPCIAPRSVKESRVMAQPSASATKLDDGQVP